MPDFTTGDLEHLSNALMAYGTDVLEKSDPRGKQLAFEIFYHYIKSLEDKKEYTASEIIIAEYGYYAYNLLNLPSIGQIEPILEGTPEYLHKGAIEQIFDRVGESRRRN
ncbi:MAG: hypothetical protein U9Q92_01715 [archaeon]|nr:hypothetical protein [archaeon]